MCPRNTLLDDALSCVSLRARVCTTTGQTKLFRGGTKIKRLGGFGAAEERDGHVSASLVQHGQVALKVVAANHIEHNIHPSAAAVLFDRAGVVPLSVVDRERGTQR